KPEDITKAVEAALAPVNKKLEELEGKVTKREQGIDPTTKTEEDVQKSDDPLAAITAAVTKALEPVTQKLEGVEKRLETVEKSEESSRKLIDDGTAQQEIKKSEAKWPSFNVNK